jgi:copper(I)-binding protein
MLKKGLLALICALIALPAAAQHDHHHHGSMGDAHAESMIAVSDAWMPAESSGMVRPVYLTLHNLGEGAVRIVGVESPDAAVAQIQRLSESYGMVTARRVRALEIPAGESLALSAPDYQIGLSNLNRDLAEGDAITLRLMVQDGADEEKTLIVGVPVLNEAPPPARLLVTDAWARPADQGAVSAAYLLLTNPGETDAVIISAQMALAGLVEIHEMIMQGDVMRMNPIPELVVPAGETALLEPGGDHIMLMDLQAALTEGSALVVTLIFDDGGQQIIGVPVYNRMMMPMGMPMR